MFIRTIYVNTWSNGQTFRCRFARQVLHTEWPQPRLIGRRVLSSNPFSQTGQIRKSVHWGVWIGIFYVYLWIPSLVFDWKGIYVAVFLFQIHFYFLIIVLYLLMNSRFFLVLFRFVGRKDVVIIRRLFSGSPLKTR